MSITPATHSLSPSSRPWEPAVALVCSIGFTAAAGAAGGASLGMVIGGFFAAALILPPLLILGRLSARRFATFFAAMFGIGSVWLGLIGPSQATFTQLIGLLALLTAFFMAFSAFGMLLGSLKLPGTVTAAATSGAAIAWLTWPIWLSPSIAGGASTIAINLLVSLNPILAANGLLTFTSPWTEQSVAYSLTLLGQDVPLRLPTNPATSIAAHITVATILFVAHILRLDRNGHRSKNAQNIP